MTSTLAFHGGTGSVTGANFLLDTGDERILVDCGLIQGDRFAAAQNADPFRYDPATVDVLFVTHAHADHIGRIPKLVRDGFQGVIYSTPPTHALAGIMLRDAFAVMKMEAARDHTELLYDAADIDAALALWKDVPYETDVPLQGGVTARLYNAGHILGSAFVQFSRNGRSIVFTGDIGNVPQPLMAAPSIPKGYDYLVMESVYGDRLHEEVKERTALLTQYVHEAIRRKGTLIIPAFSLERTQGMLLELNDLIAAGTVDPIPTFLDSPLAIEVTEVYKRFPEYMRPEVRAQIAAGDDIFSFPKLTFTYKVEQSKEIAETKGPKIIIAGSGMSEGGRIRAHEKRYLGDPNTILLEVGYQSVGSLGRRLVDGATHVTIDGEKIKVRAHVASIRGYSGHADRDQLVDFVAYGGEQATHVFVTMGEEHASLFLVQRLRDYLGVNATAPALGQVVTLDF
jgi:metallo-beta-lactamase family protein